MTIMLFVCGAYLYGVVVQQTALLWQREQQFRSKFPETPFRYWFHFNEVIASITVGLFPPRDVQRIESSTHKKSVNRYYVFLVQFPHHYCWFLVTACLTLILLGIITTHQNYPTAIYRVLFGSVWFSWKTEAKWWWQFKRLSTGGAWATRFPHMNCPKQCGRAEAFRERHWNFSQKHRANPSAYSLSLARFFIWNDY